MSIPPFPRPREDAELELLRELHRAVIAWMATNPESVRYPMPNDEELLAEMETALDALHDFTGGSAASEKDLP